MTIDIPDIAAAAAAVDARPGHEATGAPVRRASGPRGGRSARRARTGGDATLPYTPPDGYAGGIRHWPAAERPRERLYASGAQALSDGELLALFVRTGIPGRNAVDVGRAMLQRFGSLGEMLDADAAQLATVAGLGPAKIAQLQAISEIVKRSLAQRIARGTVFGSPSDLGDYLQLLIGGRPHEVFFSLYLDSRHRLVRVEESSRGTLTQTAVYPREIARAALQFNAAALVVAHNHPSGDIQPSESDRLLTRRLKSALDLLDIRLLDHFIVSRDARLSFAEHGWL
ncbi:MAG: RadC family protein [Janthinobacterium lividum]